MKLEAHVICLSFRSADAAADALAAIGPALAGSGVARPIVLVPQEDLIVLRRLDDRARQMKAPAAARPACAHPAVAGPAGTPPPCDPAPPPPRRPVSAAKVLHHPPPPRRGRLREEDIPTPTVFRPGVAAAPREDILEAYAQGPAAMQRLAAERGWTTEQIRRHAEAVMQLIQKEMT